MYFGDDKPDCKKNCDVCKNYKTVSNTINDFHSARDYQKFGLTNSADYVETFGELYGEGRGGISKESEDYSNEVSDRFGNDPNAKKDTELINTIKEQFAMRRGDSGGSINRNDDPGEKYSIVRAPEATKRKVAGLSIQTRESYVKYFKDLLKKNWLSAHERAFEFTDKDFEDAAIGMEYSIFSESKVNAAYKRKIAHEVAELRKMTSKSKPHPFIRNGKDILGPEPTPSLGRIMQGIEDNILTAKDAKTDDEDSQGSSMGGGFVTAGQMLKDNKNEFVTAGDVMRLLTSKRKADEEYDIETNGLPSDGEDADKVAHSMSESEAEGESSCVIEDNSTIIDAENQEEEEEVNSFFLTKKADPSVIPGLDEPYSPAASVEIVVSPEADDPPPPAPVAPPSLFDDSPEKPQLKRKYDHLFGDESSPEDVESPSKILKTEAKRTITLKHPIKHHQDKNKTPDKVHKHRHHDKKPRDSAADKEREAEKKEFSDVIVKYLMPYYKKRRITDKDSFKVLARKIVHTLLPKKSEYPEPEIKKYINSIYKKGLFKKSLIDIEKYSLSA